MNRIEREREREKEKVQSPKDRKNESVPGRTRKQQQGQQDNKYSRVPGPDNKIIFALPLLLLVRAIERAIKPKPRVS